MNNQTLLLTLLIHRRTKEKYYKDHDQYVEKQKDLLEKSWHEPFTALADERKAYFLDLWFWSPWRFNDIVGYAEIEMETPWSIIGHLYIQEGRISTRKPFMLNYACASAECEPGDLHSLREAIVEVVHDLQCILGKNRKIEFDRSIVDHTDYISLLKARNYKLDPMPMEKITFVTNQGGQ